MAIHVYANSFEIACTASDGTASTAFPDPCWSPPPPSAGPIVMPYGNVASASDITDGTTTIFIGGKTIAIEDKAYFSTSTGNEAATPAFQKGLQTGVINGKAYFRSWSLNVSFEGLGVDRHTDMVSHNHDSAMTNTPLFPFLALNADGKHPPCVKEEKEIEKKCGYNNPVMNEDGTQKPNEDGTPMLNKDDPEWDWRKENCEGLESVLNDPKKAEDYLKKFSDEHSSSNDKNFVRDVYNQYNAIDLYDGINKLLKKDKAEFDSLKMHLATFVQDTLATKNECTCARRCNLVPYKNKGKTEDGKNASNVQPSTDRGCCPGQTGNHLVYGVMMEDRKQGKNKGNLGCRAYNHDSAPTVCVEGASQNHGSHERIHDAMDSEIKDFFPYTLELSLSYLNTVEEATETLDQIKKIINEKIENAKDSKISMDDAIEAAARSHKKAFPESNCSHDCIVAQLKAYYKNLGCTEVWAADKQGRDIEPDFGDVYFGDADF